jgi:hypothetical protein
MPKFTIVADTMGDKRYLNPFTMKYEDGKYLYLDPYAAKADFRRLYPYAVENGRADAKMESKLLFYHPCEHHPTESDLWPAGQMFYIQRED